MRALQPFAVLLCSLLQSTLEQWYGSTQEPGRDETRRDPHAVALSFSLPAASYATTLTAHVAKPGADVYYVNGSSSSSSSSASSDASD
jgi:hypothetical protein